MYKIMLADDEGIVIDSLRFIIEKEFNNTCEIESAKTGRGAIELTETFRPDIAIMDIQMPGINGIEAIKEIKDRNPQMIFIIMTAYDKFNYARDAVNLGVFEYLNKPIDRKIIAEVLTKAMKVIDERREKRSQELIIKEKMETVIPIIENGLIYDILFHENFQEDINNFKNLLEINQDYGYMAVLVCGDEQEGLHMTNAVGASVRIQMMYRGLRDTVKEHLNCYVGSAMGNKVTILIPNDNLEMEYSNRVKVIECARQIVKDLRTNHNFQFRMGIGSVKKLENLLESYNEALEALLYTDGSVVHADDVPLKVKYEENYPIELEKGLFAAIDSKDTSLAVNTAGKFFDWMNKSYPDDVDDIRLKVMEFVLWAEHLVYEQGGSVYKFQSRKNYLSTIMGLDSLMEIRKWFIDKIEESCRIAQTQKDEQSDSIISKARKYIDDNYSQSDISLDEVSREVDISPYYFSKLFKEETGKNFIEYLTDIRIDKAKELILTTNLSMKEICAEVGYADPNYFSRNFKKNVGVTPTEFKEGIENENK